MSRNLRHMLRSMDLLRRYVQRVQREHKPSTLRELLPLCNEQIELTNHSLQTLRHLQHLCECTALHLSPSSPCSWCHLYDRLLRVTTTPEDWTSTQHRAVLRAMRETIAHLSTSS